MLRTISPQDMREMEQAFMKGTGYPSILLMEHAAQAVVDAVEAAAGRGATVLFVCGSGNNGGDGCAAARLWIQRGGRAVVWLLKSPSQMKGDAGVNARLLGSCGATLHVLYGEAPEIPSGCTAIVDALYGTGLSREIEGAARHRGGHPFRHRWADGRGPWRGGARGADGYVPQAQARASALSRARAYGSADGGGDRHPQRLGRRAGV